MGGVFPSTDSAEALGVALIVIGASTFLYFSRSNYSVGQNLFGKFLAVFHLVPGEGQSVSSS